MIDIDGLDVVFGHGKQAFHAVRAFGSTPPLALLSTVAKPVLTYFVKL